MIISDDGACLCIDGCVYCTSETDLAIRAAQEEIQRIRDLVDRFAERVMNSRTTCPTCGHDLTE